MNRRVLVVDDEALNVLTLSDILEMHGWEVESAYGGEEAVDAVRDRSFDVVVMDVRMPDMSGVDALRAMRSLRHDLKVVMMTGYSAWPILDEARDAGALRILSKPLDITALVELLDDLMAKRRPVLVVDDDPDFLATLADSLEHAGYPALRAGSVGQAVAVLRRKTPTVIVLDLRLNGLQPKDVVDAIRRALPTATFVLYSGHPDLVDVARETVPASLVQATLSKPFEVATLLGLLGRITA